MRRFTTSSAAALLAALCSDLLPAQCARLSGVIERDGKSYAFDWDGKEVTVKSGDQVVSRSSAKSPGQERAGQWLANPFQGQPLSTATLGIEDENGVVLGTLRFTGDEIVSLQVAPRRVTRASLDVNVEPPNEALAEQLGVAAHETLLVSRVEKDGAAAKAGVQRFDLIVALDGGRKVDQTNLRQILSSKRPGDELALTLVRRGEERELVVRLGASENARDGWPLALRAYTDLHDPDAGTQALRSLYATSPTTGWLRAGDEYLRYADPRLWPSRTSTTTVDPSTTSLDPASEAQTLADIDKRLAEIEEMLKRLEKKPGSGSAR